MLRSVMLAATSACGFAVHAANPAALAPGLAVDRYGGEIGLTGQIAALENVDVAGIVDARLRVAPRVDVLLGGSYTSTGFAEAANASASVRVRRRVGDELRPVDLGFGGGLGGSLGTVGDSRWAAGTHAFAGVATTDRHVRVFADAWAAAALEHFQSHPVWIGARYGLDLGARDISVRPMIGV